MKFRAGVGIFLKEQGMDALDMPKAYNPGDFESRIYRMWKESGCFSPEKRGDWDGEPFVIVIPPPNVTGVLHMGHGLNIGLQDILVRYWRMRGRPTLWVPGTDHAGIATQSVVEKRLAGEGKSRADLGRDEFIRQTWEVKNEHHKIITRQIETIGASCDWSRERFTMDEGCSRAVREAFVSLYEQDLIYRGHYMVNWCPSCGTALSDDEVEYREVAGGLWDIEYRFTDGSGSVVVATTRPETMFGDSAVAVHPGDGRYRDFVGKMLSLPLTGREVPLIVDDHVDPEFGTGALKITPAHDPNDFEIGERHGLERINIMNSDGTLNDVVPEFVRGLKSVEARKVTAEKLEAEGFLVGYREHRHQVGHCYRCGAVIEPLVSRQWFVKMRPLAERALSAWKEGQLRFYPARWENTYRHWLENIRDWCISRQIWWGHRIPAWTCGGCGRLFILREDPEGGCPDCGGRLEQDEDVLDTWFSSWLWPMSTLGWPRETEDFSRFFPGSALVSGYDIIFFWIARMVMASLHFMDKVPFRDVYITGLVRDSRGQKMSKSLGNGIDPLDVVATYGADAMKFTLAYLSAQGEDIPLGMDTSKIGSRFANKIWNATRFILMNLGDCEPSEPDWDNCTLVDQWILHRFALTVEAVDQAMVLYRFDDMAHLVYEFFWNDYCDWYVEAGKLSLYGSEQGEKNRAAGMLLYILEESLKLLHPFLPFITEELWQTLDKEREALIVQTWPRVRESFKNEHSLASFELLQNIVSSIRTLRSEFNIAPSRDVKVRYELQDETFSHVLGNNDPLMAMFVRSTDFSGLSSLSGSKKEASMDTDGQDDQDKNAISLSGSGFTVHVFARHLIDERAVEDRLNKSLASLEKAIAGKRKKLNNQSFIDRAPKEIVESERKSILELEEQAERSKNYLASLTGKT